MVVATINTNDKFLRKELEERRDIMLFERRNQESYELQDFVLIRTTNYLEKERYQRPLCHLPFIVKNNNVILSSIHDILNEQEPINFYMEEDRYQERTQHIKANYLPYSSQYRSTVHFSVNGLVSSHAKGNFHNRNFIIIDPLEYHLKNNDIRSFRLEDTYMYGDVSLSSEAVIMIKEENYEELLLQNPQLNTYNIVLYRGDEKVAVEMYLASIGIISEKIGEHGSLEHRCSQQVRKFRDRLKENFNIDSDPHWLSKESKLDDENSLLIWDYYNNLFYNFMLDKLGINEQEKSFRLNDLMNMGKDSENKEYIKMIIKKIGLEQFKQIVDEYNLKILNSIAQGTFQNNEEIVSHLKNIQK